jgi:cell division protein FtsL
MTREEIKEMLDLLKDGSAEKKLQAEITELKALVDDQRKQIRELKRRIKELKN